MNDSGGDSSDGLKLAVVIPTLNESAALPALLHRLIEDRADIVVVADGGSEDETVSIAKAAGALTVQAPRGRGQQLRAGAELALGQGAEVLWFVHADNLPSAGALDALRRTAEASTAGASAVQAWGCKQTVEATGRFYRLVEQKADRRVRTGLVYGDSGLCVLAQAYRRAGGYRAIPIFEDLDLSKRLAALGPIELVSEAEILVSARRWQGEGALRTTIRNWMLTRAWNWGVAPERLVRYYPAHNLRDKSDRYK